MRKKIIIIALLLTTIPNLVYAECTNQDIAYFKSIEDKYTSSYEYNKETKTYKLILTYGDSSKFTYLIVGDGLETTTTESDNTQIITNNIQPGNYTIYVIGATNTCTDEFKKEEIKIPKYNDYADDPICEGIEEFVLCKPTYDKEIDYNTFISRVNSYKKSKEKDNQTPNDIIEENKQTPLEWIKNNYNIIIIIAITIIIIITILILFKIKCNKEKKRRRLE